MSVAVLSRSLAVLKPLLPAKGKAVAIHISISLAIFVVLLYFIVFEWYAQPCFTTDGGWHGVRIMFMVDVVLGPVLTFVVFNPTKRRAEIVRDLSFVGLVQLSALIWGGSIVYNQRPVALVALGGELFTMRSDAYPTSVDIAAFKQLDSRRPPLIYLDIVDSPIGDVWLTTVSQYRRFDANLPVIFASASHFEKRDLAKKPAIAARMAEMRTKYGKDVAFIPFTGTYEKVLLVFSPRGEILEWFPI